MAFSVTMMANNLGAEEYLSFTQWAVSQGIEINGVALVEIPGRHLGMVTTRLIEVGSSSNSSICYPTMTDVTPRMKENEIIVTVPLAAMLTIDCVPRSFVNLFLDGKSIHGILAAFLTHGDPDLLKRWDNWREVWPTRQDFEDSMPILWPEHLRASNTTFHSKPPSSRKTLPPSVSGQWNWIDKKSEDIEYETRHQNLLAQQEKRLQEAWRNVVSVFPDTDWDTFSYHWFILNTRSFFYVTPGEEAPEDWNNAIALVPFADYFNHVDGAVSDTVPRLLPSNTTMRN